MTTLELDDLQCDHLNAALDFFGRRWNGGVLLALARGADRFSEVLRAVSGISDRMLAVRLKELEERGAVVRTVVPTTPVQIRYGLTDQGRALIEAFVPLVEVGRRIDEARRPVPVRA